MKRFFSIVCILIVLLMCCACGISGSEVLFIPDAVLMDSQNITGATFVICFNYLYNGKLPEFEVISIDGEGLENITYTCEDVTSDFELDTKYKGYKMGSQCVEIVYDKTAIGKTMTVNSIKFKVDGVEKSLNLEHPLTFTPLSEDVNAGFLWGAQVIRSCSVDSEIAFAYTAEVDATVKSFSIGKYAEHYKALQTSEQLWLLSVAGLSCLISANILSPLHGIFPSGYFLGLYANRQFLGGHF